MAKKTPKEYKPGQEPFWPITSGKRLAGCLAVIGVLILIVLFLIVVTAPLTHHTPIH